MTGDEVWISIADVAREMGVSYPTAWRMLRSGAIPGLERWYGWANRLRWHVNAEIFYEWLAEVT